MIYSSIPSQLAKLWSGLGRKKWETVAAILDVVQTACPGQLGWLMIVMPATITADRSLMSGNAVCGFLDDTLNNIDIDLHKSTSVVLTKTVELGSFVLIWGLLLWVIKSGRILCRVRQWYPMV